MNDITKTAVFTVAAIVFGVLGYLTRPQDNFTTRVDTEDVTDEFFPEFDPMEATEMEIEEYDADTAILSKFQVRKDESGLWVIPSHSNYPTDAKEQLGAAAAAVAGMTRGPVVGTHRNEYADFGVMQPEDAESGAVGIGTRVKIKNRTGNDLASIIIGKRVYPEAEDNDPRKNHYYVRLPGDTTVYTSKVDVSKLSTKFEDWIETDLLKLDVGDIKQVLLNDYTSSLQGRMPAGVNLELEYTDKAEWKLDNLAEYEELDTSALTAMKFALDDLKIVDVQPKPADLVALLRGVPGARVERATIIDLAKHGFYITQQGLNAKQGDLVVKLKNGIMYALQFGDITSANSNRYLFVKTMFDESLLEKPELEKVPELTSPEDLDALKKEGVDPKKPIATKEQIELRNKAKLDDFQKEIDKGKQRVAELNSQFAEWYYVISNEEFEKIRIKRSKIVKVKKGMEGKAPTKTPDFTIGEETAAPGKVPPKPIGVLRPPTPPGAPKPSVPNTPPKEKD